MTVLFASLKFETVAPGHLISSGNRECLIMVSRFSFLFGTFGLGRGATISFLILLGEYQKFGIVSSVVTVTKMGLVL